MITVFKQFILAHNRYSGTWLLSLILVVRREQTMKQEKTDRQEKTWRTPLDRLCCTSGLLLSITCCVAVIHVEFRIQEQQRLISQTTTVCDQIETEILRKVQQNFKRWGGVAEEITQRNKGWDQNVLFYSSHKIWAHYKTGFVKKSITTNGESLHCL